MRRFALGASCLVVAGAIASCGDSANGEDAPVPLPEREFDASRAADAAEEADSDLPVPPPPDAGDAEAGTDAKVYAGCNGALDCERVVFATTKEYGGGFGGIAEADQRCQTHADGSQNPRVKGRKFIAWVSTATSTVAMRFPHGTKAYVRPDGPKVANDWADLTDAALLAGIGVNEDGAPPGGSNRVWTGTNNVGTASAATCGTWKDLTLSGQRGNLGGSGAGWTDAQNDACTNAGHLYCFEY